MKTAEKIWDQKGKKAVILQQNSFNISIDILHNILRFTTMEEHFVNSIKTGSFMKLHLIITNKGWQQKGDNIPTRA